MLPATVKLVPVETLEGFVGLRIKFGVDSAIEPFVSAFAATATFINFPPARTDGNVPLPVTAITRTR